MNTDRPINLDLTTIKLPVTAISSILHRISGILLFLALPILLWALDKSLSSEQGFQEVVVFFSGFLGKFLTWAVLSALSYHLIAGIRHIFMDLGYGESLQGGNAGSTTVLVVSSILIIFWGIWVW